MGSAVAEEDVTSDGNLIRNQLWWTANRGGPDKEVQGEMRDLVGVVDDYLGRFRQELHELQKEILPISGARDASLPNFRRDVIRVAAERAEQSPEFEALQAAAADAAREGRKWAFREPLRHFFRRSDAYLGTAKGESVLPESVASRLKKQLRKPGNEISVWHLVSLPWADIEDSITRIETEWFCLRRYSVDELKRKLEYEARLVFYPESACEEWMLEFLAAQWWLEVDDKKKLPPFGSFEVDFSAVSGMLHFTDLPAKVEQALAVVILLGWEDEYGDRKA